jgi:hypothetical protein
MLLINAPVGGHAGLERTLREQKINDGREIL